jgi:RNA polymerase sigma-70 factor (ECF subfamily)
LQRSDAELVTAACQGDLASFGQLYERHYRMAVGIARSRLTDVHLAEDAAQEAFAIACRSLATLQQGDRFSQWLGTICRRTASRLALGRSTYEPLSEPRSPVSDSSLEVLREQVREAMEQLDETSREIVLLHYFSGLSYEEITAVVDLSPQAIHGRLQRARRKLAELLAPSGIKQ